jgi:hypothetical protein
VYIFTYISIKVEEDRRQLELLRELQLQHDLQQKTNQYNEQGDICMYICTCIYVCMYICTCIYVCMYVCIYEQLQQSFQQKTNIMNKVIYVCIYVHVYMYVCIYEQLQHDFQQKTNIMNKVIYVCIYVHVYMYVCIYEQLQHDFQQKTNKVIYTHKYICIFVCICIFTYINSCISIYIHKCIQIFSHLPIYFYLGDTEYLPAIDEALSLLIEKEEIFKEKCLHLGKNIYS